MIGLAGKARAAFWNHTPLCHMGGAETCFKDYESTAIDLRRVASNKKKMGAVSKRGAPTTHQKPAGDRTCPGRSQTPRPVWLQGSAAVNEALVPLHGKIGQLLVAAAPKNSARPPLVICTRICCVFKEVMLSQRGAWRF